MEKYVFRPYDPLYASLFAHKKQQLTQLLGPEVSIVHVGSTAVPGLGGKGILDILIGSSEEELRRIKELLSIHYTFREAHSTPDRLFFKGTYPYQGGQRVVHIHLTVHQGKEWTYLIDFREYLRDHPDAVAAYSAIKRKAALAAGGEGAVYRKEKDPFIQDIIRKIAIAKKSA